MRASPSLFMGIFYFFAALLLLQALISLRGGARYLKYFRRELSASDYAPYASVIVPCRGLDQNLHENLYALFDQHYPAFEIIFVVDSPQDPALAVIARVRAERGSGASALRTRVVVSGETVKLEPQHIRRDRRRFFDREAADRAEGIGNTRLLSRLRHEPVSPRPD